MAGLGGGEGLGSTGCCCWLGARDMQRARRRRAEVHCMNCRSREGVFDGYARVSQTCRRRGVQMTLLR